MRAERKRSRQNALGASARFELIELIGQQDLAAGRGYPHVHIPVLQELLCLLQGGRRRLATEIHAAKSIVSADQVLQLRRPISAETAPASTRKEPHGNRWQAGPARRK